MNTVLYLGSFIVFLLIWQHIRSGTLNHKTWRALLHAYPTTETPKELSAVSLDIVFFYFDDVYMKRNFKFYRTTRGLLITPSPGLFSQEKVLIPWKAIEPTELQQRGIGTMQRLKIANTKVTKIDFTRTDFVQYIRPQLAT